MEIEFTPDPADLRRAALLEAAVGVFARFGFRKASMDEVARAAGVSRQGLYLQFADKEELFRRAVTYKLARQLSGAVAALSRANEPLEARLVAACDEWSGRYVGIMGADSADLMCASSKLAGAAMANYDARFEDALAAALDASPLALFCRTGGIATADVARALHATARGLKLASQTRHDFVHGMTVAVRMFCAPLAETRPSLQE